MALPELATVAGVKSQLGITVTTFDTAIGTILNAAETMIADWCDRRDNSAGMVGTESRWISASHTEQFTGALQPCLGLRFWPVTAIASVSVVGSGSTSVALQSTSYRIDKDQRTVRLLGTPQAAWETGMVAMAYPTLPPTSSGWYAQIDTANAYPYTEVVYTGGFGAGTVPLSLQQAAIELASRMYQRASRDILLTGETLGNYSWSGQSLGQFQAYKDEFMSVFLGSFAGIGGGYI